MESVKPKSLCSNIASLQKIYYIHEDKRSNEGSEGRHSSEPEKAHYTGDFAIVAKFGGHVLHCLAFSLSNVIRKVDRLKFQLGNFLKFSIQYLVDI